MKEVTTYTASIYVGAKEHDSGIVHSIEEARAICQEYVNAVPLRVTLTPTEYIYTNGSESGFVIGLINYPRFPCEPARIRQCAGEIGQRFLERFRQFKVSVVHPDVTVMIKQGDEGAGNG